MRFWRGLEHLSQRDGDRFISIFISVRTLQSLLVTDPNLPDLSEGLKIFLFLGND